jgi:hypothetical protein
MTLVPQVRLDFGEPICRMATGKKTLIETNSRWIVVRSPVPARGTNAQVPNLTPKETINRYSRELNLARTALLVDDDPMVLAVLKDMLEDLGCEVLTAASGREALEGLPRQMLK